MANFTINGVAYQSRMIDGETQMFLMKRLLPSFTALAGVASLIKNPETTDEPEPNATSSTERLAIILAPVTRELAKIADKDVTFILNACMDVTDRQLANGVGWAKVRQNGIVQDQSDNKFVTRLSIAWNVLGENFAEIFSSFGIDLPALMMSAGGVH